MRVFFNLLLFQIILIASLSAFPYKYEVDGNSITITDCDRKFSGEVVIPDTIEGKPVTSIYFSAFNAVTGLTAVTIPASVTRLGDGCFFQCSSLKSITFLGEAPSLGYRVFYLVPVSAKVFYPFGATGFGNAFGGVTTEQGDDPNGGGVDKVVFFEENFDSLELRRFESESESDGNGMDWTDELLSGWQMIKGPNHGPTNGGVAVKEFDGWTFMNPDSWYDTASQSRDLFTNGGGVIAVADSDEYDDQADASLDASLITPVIDVSEASENSLILKFDSSWRKEPHTGYVSVQYDGGDEKVILSRDGSTPDALSETIELPINNPEGAKSLVIKWNYKGYNNWWWAIDNIELTGDELSKDTDGDGVADLLDAFPEDPNEVADTDGDGVGDNGDAFPNDPNEVADTDGDGVGDNGDAFPEDPNEVADTDGDGVGDNGDAFPEDPNEVADTDGDGVGDNGDAFPNDPNEVADTDGDGVGDNGDAFPNDPNEVADTDGDGVGDVNDKIANFDDNLITYTDDGKSITITDCATSASGDLAIPDTIEGKPVTSIGAQAFKECSGLTSIKIPDGVTSIGREVFRDCSSLNSITIPDSLTSIGDYAFKECSGLTSIKIPDGVTSIGREVFRDCTSLNSITIPDSLTSIGDYAFQSCTGLTSITIPDSVTNIGDGAFVRTSLTSVTIPDGVTSIGALAFQQCTSLKNITIPDGVTSIGNQAFNSCSSLMSITIPDSVTRIGSRAFFGCTSLTSVNLGNGITSIDALSFYGCTSLTSITIPDSVTSMGLKVFSDSPSLASITFFGTAPTVGRDVFSNVSANAKVFYLPGATGFGNTFGGVTTEQIALPFEYTVNGDSITLTSWKDKNNQNITEAVIPDKLGGKPITVIGEKAFYGARYLKNITIPDSVKKIDDYAFRDCQQITNLKLGEGLESIGEYAFLYCRSLKEVTIPDNVINIGSGAFQECYNLESFHLGENVAEINVHHIFNENDPRGGGLPGSMENLETFTVSEDNNHFSSQENVLFNKDKTTLLVAVYNKSEDYVIPNSVTNIGDRAFLNHRYLKNVTIPDSVTSIGNAAFQSCTGLTSITIPDSVKEINDYAFRDCREIKSLNFEGKSNLTSIGERAFNNCRKLTSITIPDSVKIIKRSAFENCRGLTNVILGNGLETIETFAFCCNINNLTSITIPASVTTMGQGVFMRTTSSLMEVTFLGNAPEIIDAADIINLSNNVPIFSETPAKVFYLPGATGFGNTFGGVTTEQIALLFEYTVNGDSITLTSWKVKNNQNITEAVIPDKLGGKPITVIGEKAFYGARYLKNITIPNSVTSIEKGAFYHCSSLTSITIPDSVTSIGDYAFKECSGLTSITIPDGVTSIGREVFQECTSLNSITIPDGVTSIGREVFRDCTSLNSITIPDGVTSIGERAFDNCRKLTSITIPDGVTSIGERAFDNCRKLTSITIPDSVKIIKRSAFENCRGLTNVILGNGLETIETFAFCCNINNLTSITIPASVTTMGQGVFMRTTSSLMEVTFLGNAPEIIDAADIINLSNNVPIFSETPAKVFYLPGATGFGNTFGGVTTEQIADTDGDGVADLFDAFPNDVTEAVDTDGDGVGDNGDAFPNDATETVDTDGDGVGDKADAFPEDPNEVADTDGDGVGDKADAFPNDVTEAVDTDGDGVGDNGDAFPNDATETVDTDGDGVGDKADAFPEDPNEVADTDGDGVGDKADAFPNDATETADTDGDGVGDNADPFPNGGGLNKVVFFEENFDSLELRPFESASESNGNGKDWTDELLSGWQMIKGPNHGPTNGGIAVKEFDGWTFMNPVSWNATASQSRDLFTKGVGVIAVADSDEYDDQDRASIDASLITPVIDISEASENSLILKFDSSWRNEPHTGYVSVQYDGGDERVILSRDGGAPDALNETIELPINNPEGAKSLVIKWNYKGYNNWWWAIDNIIIKSNGILNSAPVVADQSVIVDEGGSVSFVLNGNDPDEDDLDYNIMSFPKNGTLSGTVPNLTYEANEGFSGTDTFSFKVNDGQISSDLATVKITVASVNPSIIANKNVYEIGEPIGGIYSNAPGNAKDWIAVYRDGDEPGKATSIFWKYTNGSRSGEWSFGSLPSGSYRLYLLVNNGYKYVASSAFTVGQEIDGNIPVVGVKKGTDNEQFEEFVHFDPFVLELLGFSDEPLQRDSRIVLFDGAGNEIKTIQSLSGKVEENYKIKFGGSDGIPISPGDYYVAVKEGKDFLAQSAIRIKDATNSSIETTWTIFVYGHGDSNINGKFLQDIEEMRKAKGNDKFRIVLQADYDGSDEEKLAEFGVPKELWNKVSRIVFDGSGETVVDVLDEQDMDDPQVLHGFLKWGMSEYKADKYGLILWDHGAGWKGFGGDLNNNNQNNDGINLQNLEIRQAIKNVLNNNQISKFDFLSFDACLMGGVEQLVDMRDICRLYIANPETDYGHGLDYANSLAYLRMNPDMSMADFAKAESRFWDAHHDDAFDEGYKAHCSYDMTFFEDYNIKFNAFLGALLKEAKSGNSQSANLLAKLRREAIHYDNQSPRSGESVITNFIDVGSFASAVSKNFDGSLSVASLDLVNAIDNLIISKVVGSQRQDASGLSIYYPINGSVDQGYGLELAFIKDSFGGEAWIDYLAEVRQDNLNNDLPLTVQSPNPNAKSGRVEGFLSDQIDLFDVQIASYADPAIMSFEVTEGDDAYSATASLVTNEFTENVNEFLYLGEIGSGMLDGEGEYDLEWDSTMPILSLADSEFYDPIYLGGYAIEPGSNIHVSFADYLAPGTEEYVPLILYTTFDEFGYGFIDTIMEDTIQTDGSDQFSLSPVEFDQGIEPGGRLLPVYYMEELAEDEYYSYFVSFEDVFIDIPENGLEGIEISYQSVTEGNYAVELQIFDHFDNGSDILTYFLEVPEEEDEEEEEALPELSIYLENGQVVVSWPITEEIYLLERSSDLSPDQWGIVPIEELTIEGEEFVLRTAPDDKAQFYRLTD